MTVLGLLGDAAQLAITGTTGLGSMAGSLLNTGYNIYAGNRAYEAERADTAWKQKMQEQLRQDELAQQQYKKRAGAAGISGQTPPAAGQQCPCGRAAGSEQEPVGSQAGKGQPDCRKASADAAAKRDSLTGDTGLKVGKSGVSSGAPCRTARR